MSPMGKEILHKVIEIVVDRVIEGIGETLKKQPGSDKTAQTRPSHVSIRKPQIFQHFEDVRKQQ